MQKENPIVSMLSKASDLLILNLLMLLGCLPIITIGASVTAGHFVALRIKREEGHVVADFWQSFKENFKQATVVWLIFLAIAGCVFVVLWFFGKESVGLSVGCMIVLIFAFILSLWAFPILSRFVYGTPALLRNSMLLCFRHLPRTLGMVLGSLLPIVMLLLGYYALPFLLLYGLSVPVYISASLYHGVFTQLEEAVLEQQERNR